MRALRLQAAHSKTPYFPLQQVVEEYFDIKDLPMKEAREVRVTCTAARACCVCVCGGGDLYNNMDI